MFLKIDFILVNLIFLTIHFADGKTTAFLQGREYLAFGNLLNVVPEEDLYYVNFGDASVLKYFANYYDKLKPRKVRKSYHNVLLNW